MEISFDPVRPSEDLCLKYTAFSERESSTRLKKQRPQRAATSLNSNKHLRLFNQKLNHEMTQINPTSQPGQNISVSA